jgi:very-short-patch-repair endonuclease
VTKAGAKLLADYLEYASSGGTTMGATGGAELNPFEADVRDRLAACGITVVPQYGVGGYRVDFAATHPQDTDRMILAIEADGASYRESGSVRDRDRLRGEHLQRLGWRFHRLWSTSWFYDPQTEVARLREAYQRAIRAADVRAQEAAPPPRSPPPPPAADPDPPPSHPSNPSTSSGSSASSASSGSRHCTGAGHPARREVDLATPRAPVTAAPPRSVPARPARDISPRPASPGHQPGPAT